MSPRNPKTVLVPVADSSEEIETVCIVDTLVRAGAKVTVSSVTGNTQVTMSRGVKILADSLIEDVKDTKFDLIAVPGGMPGAETLSKNGTLIHMLKEQKEHGRWYAAICAAPFVVLKQHGLLEDGHGKHIPATGYPAGAFMWDGRLEKRVVVAGKCVTSGGPGTALEFALALVGCLYGNDTMDKVKGQLLVEGQPPHVIHAA